MPWCPKCKTEYRDGITVCADCGTALVEMLSASQKISESQSLEENFQNMNEEELKAFFEESQKEAMERRKRLEEGPGLYVESSKKAQEFKSGGVSLLLVGSVGLIFILLILFGFIPIHMNLFSKYLVLGVMGTMFILFMVMGFLSVKSYKKFEIKASEEDHLTKNLTTWCKNNLKQDVIDADIEENSEELLYFQRTEKMKEIVSQKFMNLDAAFLDSFIDDIYPEIFG